MKAAVLTSPQPVSQRPLQIAEVADPQLRSGHVLLRVRACGVCRTDLHIVEGELPPKQLSMIPGHQIVGEVVERSDGRNSLGSRVGVSWLGGTDGTCPYCRRGHGESLRLAHLHRLHRRRRIRGICLCPRMTSCFRYRLRSTICTLRLCFVPASSAFAVCAWPVSNVASAWDCLASARPRIWPSQFCAHGSAMCMFPREESLTATWRHRWVRPGWEAKPRSLRRNWTAPSRSLPVATW